MTDIIKRKIIRALLAGIMFSIALVFNVYAAGKLEVHFIDVGQADAALIRCDDKFMLIDGGDPQDSSLIYSYLKKQGVTKLDYIVASHGDSDHVGGLPGALQLVGGNIGTVLAPYKTLDKERFATFTEKLNERGKEITVPKAGDEYKLGSASFRILSAGGKGDNESIVLRIKYGNTSFMFTGDAPEDEEKSVINSGYEVESDVLKVSHHGSRSSSCYRFLKAVYPKIAVISSGKDNSYGHPTEETLSRLRDEGATVLRTDNNGTIVMMSDGSSITYSVQKEANQDKNLIPGGSSKSLSKSSNAEKAETVVDDKAAGNVQTYILNTNTKKFHYPSCASVKKMKDKNKKEVTDSRDSIIAQGYDPCGNCHP